MVRPFFSCVVPVMGERPYFDAALASLRNQGMGEDLEVIVQDGSGELFECSECSIDRLREAGGTVRWEREPDKGQSDALNKGFAKAKGEWIFWLNADDVLLPGALRVVRDVVGRSSTSGEDAAFPLCWVAGNQICIDERGRILKCLRANGWHDGLYRHAVPHVNGPSAFFRRELFEKVGGFDTTLRYSMDWDLWIRFMKAGARFVRIDDYLWGFRQWAGSKTQHEKSQDEIRNPDPELQRMLDKNGFQLTSLGTMKLRLWRMLDGSYLRGWIDTMLMRGRTI